MEISKKADRIFLNVISQINFITDMWYIFLEETNFYTIYHLN
jgi:hypothetical protein